MGDIQSKREGKKNYHLEEMMQKLFKRLEKEKEKEIKLDVNFEKGDGIHLKINQNGIFIYFGQIIKRRQRKWIIMAKFDKDRKITIPVNKRKTVYETLGWITEQGCEIEKL